MEFKDTSTNIKEKKEIEYIIEYKKLTADRWNEEKRMSSMAYVACSQPKSKLVIARLTNRQTSKMIFSQFSITGKKQKEKKGNQSNIEKEKNR